MKTNTDIILTSHKHPDKVLELSNVLLNTIAERLTRGERLAFLSPNDDDSLDLTIVGIKIPSRPEKANIFEIDQNEKVNIFENEQKEKLFKATEESTSILASIDNVTLSSSIYRIEAQETADSELDKLVNAKINQEVVRIEKDQIELITDLAAQKVEMILNELTASRLSKLNDLDFHPETMYDVFLSYSSKDKDEARQLSSFLEKEGFNVFLAEKSIKPSSKWETTVRDALRTSRLLCLLATPNSLHSEWVITEWGAAWAFDVPILPLLFQCSAGDLPERLKSYQAINYHEMSKIISLLKDTDAG